MKSSKSIIEELDAFVPERDKHQVIEARAVNVIASAFNLISLIKESFGEEEAEELSRRLMLAIKNNDSQKFSRKIREYHKVSQRHGDRNGQ